MRFKKKEKLISLCNDILYNYMSIDSILYNQIILENLFKDYEWKNPYLNRPMAFKQVFFKSQLYFNP